MPGRIALFVEGETERALPEFLHRWIDPQLAAGSKVGIRPVSFSGVSNYLDELALKAEMYLTRNGCQVVVGLVDLYGLPPDRIDLRHQRTVGDKVRAARAYVRSLVPAHLRAQFRQHFAVHETEALLLAYPGEWPPAIRAAITKRPPEEVNFDEPPAALLKRLLGGRYKKTVYARNILGRVDPSVAVASCPYFRLFVEDLLVVAKALA